MISTSNTHLNAGTRGVDGSKISAQFRRKAGEGTFSDLTLASPLAAVQAVQERAGSDRCVFRKCLFWCFRDKVAQDRQLRDDPAVEFPRLLRDLHHGERRRTEQARKSGVTGRPRQLAVSTLVACVKWLKSASTCALATARDASVLRNTWVGRVKRIRRTLSLLTNLYQHKPTDTCSATA